MRVLSWNLFHGRSRPPAGRSLLPEFAAALNGWAWDVAVLQEVPPWWPPRLAAACDASWACALTGRNWLLPLRRAIATRNPDLLKANGGGANAILVRGAITARACIRLTVLPERRVAHGVLLADGLWCVNLHAQVRPRELARRDVDAAARAALAWAGGGPVLLGGDFNVPDPIADGFATLGGRGVDHVLGHGLGRARGTRVLDGGRLSDHSPVLVDVEAARRQRERLTLRR